MLDLTVFAAVAVGAVSALMILWLALRGSPSAAQTGSERESVTLPMLFEDGVLVDADDVVWELAASASNERATWPDVQSVLQAVLPALPSDLPTASREIDLGYGAYLRIASLNAKTIHVCLTINRDFLANWIKDGIKDARNPALHAAVRFAPNPIWFSDTNGTVLWANERFDALAEKHAGRAELAKAFLAVTEDRFGRPSGRISLQSPGDRPNRWFEVVKHADDAGTLYYANAIDAVVQAEEAQRNFVQTLTKTFAHLTTGLAIFDRDRRLALFNPALIDLSGLSAEFLTGRPNLFLFFDKLRENQMMPEPKNYGDWRERMARLVAAASDDRFQETWNLSSGLTYRVSGRPHPDGAIAFLIEDISAEISLTRRFRAEIDISQSVLDAMEDTVAVFNQLGVLTMCNAAYKSLWSIDPEGCFEDHTIVDATRQWSEMFLPNPLWQELREFVTNLHERACWDHELTTRDGSTILCRIDPIAQGSTLVRFTPIHPTPRPDQPDAPALIANV